VPGNDRETNKWEIAITNHEVPVTHAAGADTDEYFAMAWRGNRSLFYLKLPSRFF
jgi:hypothetical protein